MVMSSNRLIRKMSGSYLKWENHINNICGKANKTLGFLHHNLNINSTSIKTGLPIFSQTLEYVSSVWDLHLKTNINKIEMVQWKAAKYVNNRQQNTSSVGDMLQHLKWHCLEDRPRNAHFFMMYKIFSVDKVAVSKCDRLSPPMRHSRNMHSLSYQVPLIMVM